MEDEDDAVAVTIPELDAIEEAALLAKSNKALTFLAPPDLALRHVRSHRAASVGALVKHIEAGDVEEELVARIQSSGARSTSSSGRSARTATRLPRRRCHVTIPLRANVA